MKHKELDGSAEEYRKYFNELSGDFETVMNTMKMMSDSLPPGMKEYCQFIFSAASASKVAFKIVNDRAQKINKLSKEAFSGLGKAVMGNEKNLWSGRRIIKAGGDPKAMNAEWGK